MVTVLTPLWFDFLFLLIKDSYFPKLQMVIAPHSSPTELTGRVDADTAAIKLDKPQTKQSQHTDGNDVLNKGGVARQVKKK